MRRFETTVQVRSYELDILGHVNNAVYLNWLEQARLAALEELGLGVEALIDREWLSNVVRIEIDYRRPARFGDRLRLLTWVERLGRTSLSLGHRILREGEGEDAAPTADARVVVVWLDAGGRPTPIPREVRERLEAC
ncbi:MAG: acyl-CoA thioesterase [Gemmatimonadota bacterium]